MKYTCPSCATEIAWDPDNENKPFCSEQCKNKDFVNWANETNVIAGNSLYDDVLSEDLNITDINDYKK